MEKPTSSNKKPNYHKISRYLFNQQFDESYALLSHYIQIQGNDEANIYKKLLLEHGIDIEHLPSTDNFNKELDIPFPPSGRKFTFIDLFAGIGGFRLAMQNLGGRCVFSSEWDEAAKQTYFENYGEVPFGDITKPETKALIPKKIDVLCAGFPCQPFSYEGQLQQFYITDDHEPIVSRAVFSEVQSEVQRRAEKHKGGTGTKSVFTGKIRCGVCGKNYRRKTTPYNTVWCCSTFNTRGKAYCASKVIPENTIKDCISDALGSKYFAEDFFTETVDSIVAEPGNTMRLIFKDGTEKKITWQDRSRSESWTDDMREAARQKQLERNGVKI